MNSVNASLDHGPNQILSGVNAQDIISQSHMHGGQDSVPDILRSIPGNDVCAECSTPEPDWASLNLGVLLCIECSGVHRNLGVHISKVCNWVPIPTFYMFILFLFVCSYFLSLILGLQYKEISLFTIRSINCLYDLPRLWSQSYVCSGLFFKRYQSSLDYFNNADISGSSVNIASLICLVSGARSYSGNEYESYRTTL